MCCIHKSFAAVHHVKRASNFLFAWTTPQMLPGISDGTKAFNTRIWIHYSFSWPERIVHVVRHLALRIINETTTATATAKKTSSMFMNCSPHYTQPKKKESFCVNEVPFSTRAISTAHYSHKVIIIFVHSVHLIRVS